MLTTRIPQASLGAARWCALLAAGCAVQTACQREVRTEFQHRFGPEPVHAAVLPELGFGVEPMRSSRRLWERYSPLVDALNTHLTTFKLRLESAQLPWRYEDKLRSGALDFAIVDPHRVLDAEKAGYYAFARTGRRDRISGVVVVRRDRDIRTVKDLEGGTIALADPNSLAATMLVRSWLRDSGLDERKASLLFAGNEDSALMQVYVRGADAAGASRLGWENFSAANPHIARWLDVKWHTEGLSGPAVMAHKRVPKEQVRSVAVAIRELGHTPNGQLAIHTAGFEDLRPAELGSYDDVWEFVTAYRRTFRGPSR